ncbi:MAG: YCF48-related protein [Pyrinomonadaceae bacterium]
MAARLTILFLLAVLFVAARPTAVGNWTKRSAGTMTGLRSVYFLDDMRGWAAGGAGTLLTTSDGGQTWQIKRRWSGDILWDVYFADAQTGWLLAERSIHNLKTNEETRSYVLHTKDGGATWTRLNLFGLDPGMLLVRFAFAGKAMGYVFGEYGTLYASSGGEELWSARAVPTRRLLLGGSFIDGGRGWLVGAGATLLQTIDGGESWREHKIAELENARLNAVVFVDERHGWAVGAGGTIVRTADGGKKWETQTSANGEDLFDVKFIDKSEGWAVGANGTILHTIDGGVRWFTERSGTGHPLARLFFNESSRRGCAVGFGGTILTYAPEVASPE